MSLVGIEAMSEGLEALVKNKLSDLDWSIELTNSKITITSINTPLSLKIIWSPNSYWKKNGDPISGWYGVTHNGDRIDGILQNILKLLIKDTKEKAEIKRNDYDNIISIMTPIENIK